jgi:hypothetical protein
MHIHTAFAVFWGILCTYSAVSAQSGGSITQGAGTTTVADLLPDCPSNHVAPLGTINSTDGKTWIVPAETNFQTGSYCADLHNTCNNLAPPNLAAAILANVPVMEIDTDGDLVTGFIFADNYFELFINGVLVGVDPVPFTPFNSCVVKFRVKKPYTLAVKLVDWEENPGLGSEINNGNNFHPGDGGFIAQFSDGTVTDSTWRAQTFYIAPIQNLNDVVELPDGTHSTATANNSPTCNASCYGIHYDIPADWMHANFNDSDWPNAVLYTAAQVTNQAAFKNFETTAWANARFIWTSNLVLDNVVLARKTVRTTAVSDLENRSGFRAKNPFSDKISLFFEKNIADLHVRLFNLSGIEVAQWPVVSGFAGEETRLALPENLPDGIYFLQIHDKESLISFKLVHRIF